MDVVATGESCCTASVDWPWPRVPDDFANNISATTLAVNTRGQARAVVGLYAQRWSIETGFETMHAWGQDRFMVRRWTAIDRLLWVLALAYALVVLALYDRTLRRFRDQAITLLKQVSVVGDDLTVGTLAEAISLDDQRHQRAWTSAGPARMTLVRGGARTLRIGMRTNTGVRPQR